MISSLGFIRLHPLRHFVCLAAGFCLHSGAYAQPDAVSDPSLRSLSWTLEPINVSGTGESYSAPSSASATRTETPLIEVPQSVQVVTRAMLREQGSHSLADALVNVSGVRATKPQEALFTQPIVRGFPAEIYGLPAFGGTAASIDPTSLIGTERIEVLKGLHLYYTAGELVRR